MMTKRQKLIILSWLFVVGGIFGFIYEELFYRIDLGFWVKRGSTFGPWIPIYGFGSLLIFFVTEKVTRHPVAVFVLSALSCGLLELGMGFLLHRVFDIRLWDYNTEILNFGNIGGYVCLRSVLLFGFCGLAVRYIECPILRRGCEKLRRPWLQALAFLPFSLFVLDMLIYMIVK